MTPEVQKRLIEKLAQLSHEKFREVLSALEKEGVLADTAQAKQMMATLQQPYEKLPEETKNGSRSEALGVLGFLKEIGAVR